ncbi:MAG: MmgE/PrpD family protein [Deltaproteobacteria bacterium]|nr:MmgE/PrpD family protein [Deltaproteobacteria bacterium]
MDGLADRISEFVVGNDFDRLPPEVVAAAKSAFLDCVGVALAGSDEESARICAAMARQESGAGEATVIGHGFQTSATLAALCNGTSAHALDFDHSYLMGQPTAGLIPAVLTMGETLGATGRDVLAAYVAGFEVVSRLARSIPQLSTHGHWHATSSFGTVGAAACCARLAGLDAGATRNALGIAASMASGMVWNFATMTKPLHSGLAAQNGVLATRLAGQGFTSSPAALEEGKGVFDCFGRGLECDASPFETLGRSFDLTGIGISVKPYPCGGLTHAAVDAVLELRQEGLRPDQVDSIRVGVTSQVFDRIMNALPANGIESKFSMPYILARALVDGALVLDTFTDEAATDPAVRRLAETIVMELDAGLVDTADGARPADVTVRLKDGGELRRRVDHSRGRPEKPMTPAELRQKFDTCAARALDAEQVGQVAELIAGLEGVTSIRGLCELLAGSK